jgi:hypothetical protein
MTKRSLKIKVPTSRIVELAVAYCADHAGLTSRGFRLSASSGFWKTQRQGMTARFVYRHGETTITHILRGIPA